ncbi:tRNA (uridine(34)/cytosine(34)/5-carboxymethylaminomethyluridine(34)-2'-O)-methyltransferase TrmL [Granulicatella sp. zg-ZJ]|uniref:tRNA (uridine(34)/cytosine(34)/5- carboxymethylaminomethyluridine(34)-2'-O)- methyltransferase TrmL n=1 Tax=unclassified Granulicatella TaxID=2630493 RepID=UPI0013BEB994|nr:MULTISPECIES: tRNA (uridine(34)/cytosine(34)/5-carboxymethylaminomethyluridine(34)-2'-O)-methyltransferase TrmL [unclassified Granulicatella]MBS4750018.1 tRNA (uridine(34)/cytosine(34)/5-carboxymethylaminomethyluridine(34)-2'-O)-methyltransferase TrmL [Carnobacteriaceae bacterium zg-ZUI78]NEW62681.1 tRNA (uridine(34)/cytosine(34)/5-carboxymethylaminomethyluridine(34)-2'-O)-methyltransferase TrmL [Granulicatella sp. zg-ZJ]NEW65828.1 tRNA (uridine(34)/cytosine(34)/5-carboxymethylaminomethylurid
MTNHIVLFEPQIPANTGNIARTCAATNTHLHLIEPLGFSTDDKQLKRAGLDYWHDVTISYYKNLDEFLDFVGNKPLYLVTKFAKHIYSDITYQAEQDYFFVFGKETTGLPESFMQSFKEQCIRVPMNDEHVRSLNLSNTAALVIYEVLRQQGFPHLELTHTYDTEKAEHLGW